MKRRKNPLPDEILQGFQNGTSDSHSKAVRVWELLDEIEDKPLNVPSTDQALQELDALIDASEGERKRAVDRAPVRLQRRFPMRRVFMSMAVAAVLLLVSSAVYFSVPVKHTTIAGEHLSVLLPDGTEVELNNSSSIQYKRSFREWYGGNSAVRTVVLDGEAFLTVAKDGRPFKVETFNAQVTVLGTGFNVRAYSGDSEQETRITLEHGKVQVDVLDNTVQESVLLSEEGQQAVVKNTELKLSDAPVGLNALDFAVAWRSNGFVAMGLSLESLFKQIERHYGKEISVSDALSLKPTDLIYRDSEPAIEQILTDFCIAELCSYRETASGYLISHKMNDECLQLFINPGLFTY